MKGDRFFVRTRCWGRSKVKVWTEVKSVVGKRTLIYAIIGMFIAAIALVVPLLTQGHAQSANKIPEARERTGIPSDIVVTEMHIALIKYALNLRPEQESQWAPVEAALRDLAQWQTMTAHEVNFVGAGERGAAGNGVVTRLKRIATLAQPLIKMLDQTQRRDMMALARSAGLEQLLAAH